MHVAAQTGFVSAQHRMIDELVALFGGKSLPNRGS
jgi:hypothetical protein